jgi:hypothetical protein
MKKNNVIIAISTILVLGGLNFTHPSSSFAQAYSSNSDSSSSGTTTNTTGTLEITWDNWHVRHCRMEVDTTGKPKMIQTDSLIGHSTSGPHYRYSGPHIHPARKCSEKYPTIL